MAPPSGDIYKTYFNDPTLSDLTILLSDQKVHVHRIILCRCSKYFNRLILNGFKVRGPTAALIDDPNSPPWQESSLKQIPLHGDDPVVMMGLFRYMYDRSYERLNKDKDTGWQFLANVYVAADKYEIGGLTRNVIQRMKTKLFDKGHLRAQADTGDFMAAVKIIFHGTTSQDKIGRAAMVDLCVCCIRELRLLPEFEILLSECNGLGAKIFAHERLGLMLEGSWYCGDEEHRGAVPRCIYCGDPFAMSFIRESHHDSAWECPYCAREAEPVCIEDHIAPTGEHCEWVWED